MNPIAAARQTFLCSIMGSSNSTTYFFYHITKLFAHCLPSFSPSYRNPAASFGEVSKHVAALWDAMDPDAKGAYKRRTEQAKKEYLRQLAAYRATLVSKGNTLENPYNGKGLEVTKVGEERTYLMNQR